MMNEDRISPLEECNGDNRETATPGNNTDERTGTSVQDAWTDYLDRLVDATPDSLAAKVQKAAFAPKGERRTLTLLTWHGSLIGDSGRQLNDESEYFIVDKLIQTISKVVYTYEGLIDHYDGMQLMAIFGLPTVHENDAGRALYAALDLLSALVALNEELLRVYGVRVLSRIGVHVGPVIVSRLSAHSEWHLVGLAVQRADTLRDNAPADGILVSHEVHQQTKTMFDYIATSSQSQPEAAATMQDEPAFLLMGLRPQPSSARGIEATTVPMVGRQDALLSLCDSWQEVLIHGKGCVAVITGEAGVGKTRLLSEFISTARDVQGRVYQGSCETYARRKPLYLISNLLYSFLGISSNDSFAAKYEALTGLLVRLDMPVAHHLPFLSSILDLPIQNDASTSTIDHLDDTVLQKMTHASLQQLIKTMAADSPILIVIEDLHWVDPASLRALVHLVQTINDTSVMFVLVSRDSEQEDVVQPILDSVINDSRTPIDIRLSPFQRTDCEEFVNLLLFQDSPDDNMLRDLVVQRSEGNPFYAEEIVRMLLDQGALHTGDETYEIMPDAITMIHHIPPTLVGLLMARMDNLAESQRRVLQVASVIGSQITASVISGLLGVNVAEVESSLRTLVERGFLISEAKQSLGLHSVLAFRHALVQEAVYGTLLSRDQKQLHGWFAQKIEQDEDISLPQVSETLAYHYYRSSQPEKSAPYLLATAKIGSRRSDYSSAIECYQKAFEPRVVNALSQQEFLQAKIEYGRVLKLTGQYRDANDILESALQEALFDSLRTDFLTTLVSGIRELADIRHMEGENEQAYAFLTSGLMAIEEDDKDQHFELARSMKERMSWIRFREGRLDDAFTLASSATQNANIEQDKDPITLASLYNTLGGISWQRGEPEQAAEYLAMSLKLYRRVQYPSGMANTYINLGVLHYSLGSWPLAEKELTRAVNLWKQIGDSHQRAVALNNLGNLYQAMGTFDEARVALDLSLELFNTIGNAWGRGRANTSLARLCYAMKDFDAAARYVSAAEVVFQDMGHIEIEVEWVKAAILHETQQDGAHRVIEQALALAHDRSQLEEEIACLRLLGEIKTSEGQYDEAENLLRKSIDLCLQANLPYGLGLALVSLGELYRLISERQDENQQHYVNRAKATFHRAIERFNELGAKRDLSMAQNKLSKLKERTQMGSEEIKIADSAQETPGTYNTVGQALPDGDNRTVTIVWISTLPQEQAAEEDIFDTLTRVQTLVSQSADSFHARMVQHRQALMLVFGADRILEDDAERAVLAAHDIHAQLANDMLACLRLGIGIDTGKAISGYIGSELHSEFFVHGQPVDQARQLALQAPVGKMRVTQSVQQATAHIARYTEQDTSSGIWILDTLTEKPVGPRGIKGLRARMVGREDALRQMMEQSSRLADGEGALIWIEGEPGIGKSRLMNEYASAMEAQGVQVLSAKCTPHSSTRPFSLFSDLLKQIFDILPTDDPTTISSRIATAFESYASSIQTTRPYMEVILGIWPPGLPGERLSQLEPEQLRQQIFVSVRRFVKQLSRQESVVVLLDDMHWIDPISAELLSFLLTLVASGPIVLVCAQRRQGSDAPNDRLVRVQSLMPDLTLRLSLERLSESDRSQLLDELLPNAQVPNEIKRVILDQSAGNPYFVEEYLKTMLDQGLIIRQENGWLVRGDLSADKVHVPSTLEALLRSRVDSLSAELREVMQTAAVLGSPFDSQLLNKVLDRPAGSDALSRLASRLLVRPIKGGDRWEFHHPMFADVIYSSMLQARRRSLHASIAKVLLRSHDSDADDNVEILAFHLMKAGMVEQALVYLVTAGERAAARFANEAAIDYLETAGNALSTAPNTPDGLRWRLAAVLADVYRALGRHEDAMAALRAGLALTQTGKLNSAKRGGLYRRLGETSRKQGDHAKALRFYKIAVASLKGMDSEDAYVELARTYLGTAWVHFRQGSMDLAFTAVKSCQEAAEKADALAELSAVENLLGGIYFRQNQWEQAEQHTRRAMVLREQMGYTWGVANTLSNLGILAVLDGSWQKARSYFVRSLSLREEMDDADGLALSLNNLGTLSRDQGDLTEADAFFRRSLATLQRFDHSYHYANAQAGVASVLCLQGHGEAARNILDSALLLAEELGAGTVIDDCHRWRIESLYRDHSHQEAMEAIAKAEEIAGETKNQAAIAILWRLSSEIALDNNRIDLAREYLRHARDVLENATDILEQGRHHLQAGRIALSQGDREVAKPELRAAQQIFLQLGARSDLDKLHSLVGDMASI